jgi:Dolichyl-phosphate-mannose-protein mannosyltransferase
MSLALLGLVSMAMVAFCIAPLGAGVSTDAAIQMSTAENLLHGKGFIDFAGRPFVSWPPLYPLILAGFSYITRGDSLIAGGYFNVLLAGLVVWLGGLLLYDVFSNDPFWAFAGAVILATSQSLIRIAANISTDPLFYVFTLAFLLAANRYLVKPTWKKLLVMALFTALACLQRLPGVTLLITGILLVIRAHPGERVRQLIPKLFGFSLSLLPLAVWVIGHNYLGSDSLVGNRNLSQTWPLYNLKFSIERIYDWFFPHRLLALIPFSITAGASLILFLLLYHTRSRFVSLWKRLLQPALFPGQLLILVYLVVMIFSYNSNDSDYLYFDRYQLVILAPVIILVFTILQIPWNESRLPESKWLRRIPLAILLVWLAFPLFSDISYITVSRAYGVLDYNIYNTRDIRQLRIIPKIQQLTQAENPIVYSNYPAEAWLYTRSPVYYSPRGPNDQVLNADQLVKENQGWPGDQPAYLVWFLPNNYHHILPPNQLSRLAQLSLVYNDPSGKIYQAVARQQ